MSAASPEHLLVPHGQQRNSVCSLSSFFLDFSQATKRAPSKAWCYRRQHNQLKMGKPDLWVSALCTWMLTLARTDWCMVLFCSTT